MAKIVLHHVHRVFVIASGKGGVGKTTTTVNLAMAFQRAKLRVGIFDADIYGPNIPLMLGIHRRQQGKGYAPIARHKSALPYIRPLARFGLQIMSMGLLVAEDQVIDPARGGDSIGQLTVQTLKDTVWDKLDVLLIDLPPSAGQPQGDVLRFVPLDGALIVTTPQDLSLLDASRSLQMFQQHGVPILGIIENMSYFICPNCEVQHDIFQRPKKWRPPALDDVPLLGRIPLDPQISKAINKATPLVETEDGEKTAVFQQIAHTVINLLD